MESNLNYTQRSYRVSMWILLLLALAGLMISLNMRPLLSKILFGLPIVASGLLGFAGTYFIIKGMHEPLTEKKVIALTVNSESASLRTACARLPPCTPVAPIMAIIFLSLILVCFDLFIIVEWNYR